MTTLDHLAQCALRIELAGQDLAHERSQLRRLVARARREGVKLALIGETIGVSEQRVWQLTQGGKT